MQKMLLTASTAALLLGLSACGGGSSGGAGPAPIPSPPTNPNPGTGGGEGNPGTNPGNGGDDNGGGSGNDNDGGSGNDNDGDGNPPPPANSPEYLASGYLTPAKAQYAYDMGFTGAGVTIAVIDTGIDLDHEEFTGRISEDSKSFSANYVTCMTCDPETVTFGLDDKQGHGTWVASVAAGAKNDEGAHGVAYDSTILALKVAGPNMDNIPDDRSQIQEAGINISALPEAINYAISKGAFVVNLSANGGATAFFETNLKAAMDNVRTNDRLFVQSVSNFSGDSFANSFTEQLLGDGYENQDWFLYGIRVDSSLNAIPGNGTPGAMAHRTLAVVADAVTVAHIDGETGVVGGNSFAAPAIAGAAALLKQYWPQLGGKAISEILLSTATDLGETGVDQIYGAGLLNIEEAFKADAPKIGSNQANLSAVADTGLVISPAFGGQAASAVLSAAAGNAVVLDSWGRDYALNVGALVGGMRSSGISLAGLVQNSQAYLAAAANLQANMGGFYNFALNSFTQPAPAAQFAFRLDAKHAVSGGFNSSIDSNDLITGSLLRSSNVATTGTSLNFFANGKRFTVAFANMGHGANTSETQRFEMQLRNGLSFGLTNNRERGSALGMRGSGAFQIDGAKSNFATIGWEGKLGSFNLQGEAMAGRTKVETRNSMIAFGNAVLSSGFRFKGEHPAFGGTALLGVTSPLKVERAQLNYTAPVAFDMESNSLVNQTSNINLAPSAREMNVELGWARALNFAGNSFLSVNGAYGFNSGNVQGQNSAAAWLRFNSSF